MSTVDPAHPEPAAAGDEVVGGTGGAVLLAGRGLVKRYGALTVLDDVDFTVREGEAIGIVGPNGAGKTTLLSALTGTVPVSGGSIELLGHDVTSDRVESRCRRGLGRAFQVPRPFGGMTVLENVLVGATAGGRLHSRAAQERSIDVLELCGLVEVANRRAADLGLLHRKRLELARALATGPRVLLLDEIGGGLTDAEALELVDTVLALRERGVAIVWIEHIVHVLLKVVDRLICMDSGAIIADGEPRAVLADPAVIEAYLGRAVA